MGIIKFKISLSSYLNPGLILGHNTQKHLIIKNLIF